MNKTPKSKQNADGDSMVRLVSRVYVGNSKINEWLLAEDAAQKKCPLAWGFHIPMPDAENWKLESIKIDPANDNNPATGSK